MSFDILLLFIANSFSNLFSIFVGAAAATDLSQKEPSIQQFHQQHQHSFHIQTSNSSIQHQKAVPLQHQFVSLALPSVVAGECVSSALSSNGNNNNGNNTGSAVKSQNQSPRPPSILRKRPHDQFVKLCLDFIFLLNWFFLSQSLIINY